MNDLFKSGSKIVDENASVYLVTSTEMISEADYKIKRLAGGKYRTVLMECDVPSRTKGNVFPLSDFKRSFDENANLQELISNNMLFAEMDHPAMDDVNRYMTVDPNNIAANLSNVTFNKNVVEADIKYVKPKGEFFESWITECNSRIPFSVRAVARTFDEVTENGRKLMVRKYPIYLITWDSLSSRPGYGKARLSIDGVSENADAIKAISRKMLVEAQLKAMLVNETLTHAIEDVHHFFFKDAAISFNKQTKRVNIEAQKGYNLTVKLSDYAVSQLDL